MEAEEGERAVSVQADTDTHRQAGRQAGRQADRHAQTQTRTQTQTRVHVSLAFSQLTGEKVCRGVGYGVHKCVHHSLDAHRSIGQLLLT